MSLGKLFLLPNLLSETATPDVSFPPVLSSIVPTLQGLICESDKEGRKFLRRFLSHDQMAALPLKNLNEHTIPSDLHELLNPLLKGETWGLISDAGLPSLADPGSELVSLAHQKGITIDALIGPCSIVLALQRSGFSGQRFTFHGYLPREIPDLERKIKELEKKSREETQIWIEAPYRSAKMVELLQKVLQPSTRLCVAVDLMGEKERVVVSSMKNWRGLSIGKEPAVFLIG
jgi:16S rRNA (cytidine1402-2'-O)-methyltransferase